MAKVTKGLPVGTSPHRVAGESPADLACWGGPRRLPRRRSLRAPPPRGRRRGHGVWSLDPERPASGRRLGRQCLGATRKGNWRKYNPPFSVGARAGPRPTPPPTLSLRVIQGPCHGNRLGRLLTEVKRAGCCVREETVQTQRVLPRPHPADAIARGTGLEAPNPPLPPLPCLPRIPWKKGRSRLPPGFKTNSAVTGHARL